MSDKLWVRCQAGVVAETILLAANLVPGQDIFTPTVAAEMVDVTSLSPHPAVGWVTSDGGKTFTAPPAAAPLIPAVVTSAQAKIQLLRTPGSASGKTLLDDVTAAVNASGGEVAIWFSDARTWERANGHVNTLATALKLTTTQVDTLFTNAAGITA